MTIGQWVRRTVLGPDGDVRATTKWHLIDSVVDDEPVTRCGRRLRKLTGTARRWQGYATSDVMPLTRMIGQPQLCSDCQ